MLVAELAGGEFHGMAFPEEFAGVLMTLVRQPGVRQLAVFVQKIALQRAIGYLAQPRQLKHRPLRLPGQPKPIFYMCQSMRHEEINELRGGL